MMTINEVLKSLQGANPDARVYFAFCRCVPTNVNSWRGSYDEPALGWDVAGYRGSLNEYPTVKSLISELEKAIDGREYTGWKGGQYKYTCSHVLHVDNHGHCTNTEIQRIEVKEYEVIIHTATEGE